MKLPTKRRKYHTVFDPTSGLQYDLASTLIDERKTPNCSEVLFREHEVRKNYGTTIFGGGTGVVTGTSGLSGTVQYLESFYKSDNSAGILICHTAVTGVQSAVNTYNTTTKVFTPIANGTGMTASDTYFITSENMNDKYIFCNNKDTLKKWTGSGAIAPLVSGTGASSLYYCQKLLKYGERMCLFRTTEGGTLYPQRIRWSVVNGEDDYTGTGSGFADLKTQLGQDFIQTGEKLGNYVVIYGEDTIVLMDYKGDVNNPFSFDSRVSGVGLPSMRAIVNLGDEHIFLGWEDVYSYKGGREVSSVCKGLSEEVFSVINPESIHISFMIHVSEREEILLFLPTAGSDYCNMYYRYSLKNGSWSKGDKGAYTGFGFYELKTSRTWAEMTMAWSAVAQKWNESTLLALSAITLVGNTAGGISYIDETTQNWSDGSAVVAWWDTKDFVIGSEYERNVTNWMEFNFEAKGNTVNVQYSVDGGVTWSGAKTFTLSTTVWDMYNYDFEVCSDKIRFRFSNSVANETFVIRMFEIGYVESSDRGK